MTREKVVLAYSGGLDTSVILKWLTLQGKDVLAYVADVGQDDDFDKVRNKALELGASKVHVDDLKAEFVTECIFPALKGSAIYEGRYLLGTSLARPLIAKGQIKVAAQEDCQIVSHGATGKGNDQVRFELSYYALNPDIRVLAPWKCKDFLSVFQGRTDLLAFAKEQKIPVEATTERPYSMDSNLMHTSYEAGILEDPGKPPPADMFRKTASPEHAPDAITSLAIEFQAGVPIKVSNLTEGVSVTDPLEMFVYLNSIGGKNGIGRIDIVENRYVGIKSRGIYETPGATILWKVHQDLEIMTIDREVFRLLEVLRPRFSELIYYGYWFSPEMDFLRNALEYSQRTVTGSVHLTLYKGNITICGREAATPLYNQDLSSMDRAGGYNQADAEGFIRINALRLQAMHAVRGAQ